MIDGKELIRLTILSLPPVGSPMTEKQLDAWLLMARKTLEYAYPVEVRYTRG